VVTRAALFYALAFVITYPIFSQGRRLNAIADQFAGGERGLRFYVIFFDGARALRDLPHFFSVSWPFVIWIEPLGMPYLVRFLR